jgi:hypothetical protein
MREAREISAREARDHPTDDAITQGAVPLFEATSSLDWNRPMIAPMAAGARRIAQVIVSGGIKPCMVTRAKATIVSAGRAIPTTVRAVQEMMKRMLRGKERDAAKSVSPSGRTLLSAA